MKVTITAKTKKQKEKLHKGIIDAIKSKFDLFSVSDMLYHGCEWSKTKGDKNKGADFQGCSIQIVDTKSGTNIKKEIQKRGTNE